MNTTIYHQLLTFLRPLGRRLRLRSSIQWLTRTAWIACAACAVILLSGRLWPIDGYRAVAGGLLAGWLIGWAIYSVTRSITPFRVARRADVELNLRDRLATALVLSDPEGTEMTGFDDSLAMLQVTDALVVAQSIAPRRAFPVRIERAHMLRAAAAALVSIGLLVLPNPMDAVVTQRAQVAQTAQAEAAKLEKLSQQIEQNKSLNPDERAALLRQMREMIERLKSNPGDAKKALADLAKFQEQLRAKLDPAAPSAAAAMDALAQQLAQLAGAKDKPKDSEEAAKLLEQLASELDKLSPEQRDALASALERAAAQTAGGNPELAHALSAMAQAARTGASEQSTQRAAQAAQAMRESANRQALQEALARALNQADSTQRALAQAGQPNANPNSQNPNPNQGQGQGQGQNQGQGQSQGQAGQPGGGGGTTANTLPPARRTGRAGSPTDANKPFGVGDAETVYTPFNSGQGRDEFVSGQQGQDGQTQTQQGKSPQPGTRGPALVPYSQVYRQYAQIAGQTMERTYIPSGLQDYVKEYFSALEP